MSSHITAATAYTSENRYITTLISRQHAVMADEPEDIGGKDTAPRPGEFLCMSLASCTAITLQMYADRKGWDTGIITVTVTRIMNENDTDFQVEIHLEKELDEASKQRMMIIADKCPVHKVLSHPIRIESKYV